MNLHHAPWSRWFKTFYCKGQYAHELQVGPLVYQWFYQRRESHQIYGFGIGRHLCVWRDRFWRASLGKRDRTALMRDKP